MSGSKSKASRGDAESWSSEGRRYEAAHSRVHFLSRLLLSRPAWFKDGTLVDLGGGPGALRRLLEPSGVRVWVVDLASRLEERVLLHDLRQPLIDAPAGWPAADVVVLSGILEYMDDWAPVLGSARRLGHAGTVCVATYVNFMAGRYRGTGHPWWTGRRSPREAEQTFASQGLRVRERFGLASIRPSWLALAARRDHLALPLARQVGWLGQLFFAQTVWVLDWQ